jgi:hypothetical protein
VNAKRPVAYAEIVGEILQASGVNDPTTRLRSDRERAIRRALKGLCDRDLLSTLGSGRPGDPYRYTLNAVCVLCREEISDGGLTTEKGGIRFGTICFECAGSIARAYFATVLPERIAKQINSEADIDKAPTTKEIGINKNRANGAERANK